MNSNQDRLIGQILPSNSDGDFEVLENIGRISNSSYDYYNIRFLLSDAINIVRRDRMLQGIARDPNYGIDINRLQYSNLYGPFRVLKFITCDKTDGKNPDAIIRFVNTNTERQVQMRQVKNGEIDDPNANKITHIDTTILPAHIRDYRIHSKLLKIYGHMKSRCYNPKAERYKAYGAIGITMCDRWKESSENFVSDAPNLKQFDKFYRFPTKYQFEKDWLQLHIPKNQRIYSPETCMFLHYYDNNNVRTYEKWLDDKNNGIVRYFGVTKGTESRFEVGIIVDNKHIYLGSFNNIIAAASCYNWWFRYYHRYELIMLQNDIDEMSPEEFIKYNTNPKQLYHVVNDGLDIVEWLDRVIVVTNTNRVQPVNAHYNINAQLRFYNTIMQQPIVIPKSPSYQLYHVVNDGMSIEEWLSKNKR